MSVGAVRSQATETAIVDAAEAILDENGFDGFTIEAVAKRARASKPTIYRWWGDKVRLILDAHFRTRKVVETPPDTGSLRSDLIFLLKKLWRQHWAVEANANISRMLMAQVLIKDDLHAPYRNEYLAKRGQPFLVVLARGKDRGELPRETDTNELWEYMQGYLLYRLMLRDPMSDQQIEHYVDTMTRIAAKNVKAS
ncbi:MAG: TetR/AcrR family transcriptional regulator [Hyphomicrobium sp.]